MWLTKDDLKRETESLLIAAQDQALNTNSIKKSIYKLGVQITIVYMERNRQFHTYYQFLWDALCTKYGFECCQNWWEHNPEIALENDSAEWDFLFQTELSIGSQMLLSLTKP